MPCKVFSSDFEFHYLCNKQNHTNTLKLIKRSEIIMFCHFSVCSFLKDVLVTGGGGMSETQKVHAVLGCVSDQTANKQLILPVLTSDFSDRVFRLL